jgi:MFS transporter, PPP family, 3-phenylpropionic acid transporter
MVRPALRPSVAIQGLFVLFGVAIAAFFPFFSLFLDDRGLSLDEIGLVIAAMAAARIFTNPVWGHLADTRLGRLRTIRVTAAASAISSLALFAAGEHIAAIVLAAIGVAATGSSVGTNIDALTLDRLGETGMTEYGRIRGWESLSYAATCLGLGLLLERVGARWSMLAYAAANLAVLAWAMRMPPDPPRHKDRGGRLGAVGTVFRECPRFWGFLAAVVLVWVGFNGAWNFIALKIEQGGGGPLLVGIGTALGGAVEVPVMRLCSRLAGRVGLRSIYAAGCCIYATGFLLWGLIDDPTIVSILTVLEGAGFALLFTSGVVIVGRLVPPSLHSTGLSIAVTTGFGVAPMLGAGIGGFVYERLGAVTLYTGTSLLALTAAVVAWFALATPSLAQPGWVPEVAPGVQPETGSVP